MISNTNVCRTNAEIFVVLSPTNEKICPRMDAQRGLIRLEKSNKKPLPYDAWGNITNMEA